MKEYKCPKCNSKNLFVKKVGNNTGLYCGDCGAWIKWVGKNELRIFEYLNRQKYVDDSKKEHYVRPTYLSSINVSTYANQFGKTIFLTREEAEKKLEEMKK